MPFVGVLPDRVGLFQPQPHHAAAVSDAAAWQLNPRHRHIYDRLSLALAVGLAAAPCGVDPIACGVEASRTLFVKPIINLAGMALQARAVPATEIPIEPGSFWCERLVGEQSSSDLLVDRGEPFWFAHTIASSERDAGRPCYWRVGVDRPDLEPILRHWIGKLLPDYSGLCNIELIDGRPIEIHLRGSNGFFDLYGEHFIAAWVALIDQQQRRPPPPIPGGVVISLFGSQPPTPAMIAALQAQAISVQIDHHTADRSAILRSRDVTAALAAWREMSGRR